MLRRATVAVALFIGLFCIISGPREAAAQSFQGGIIREIRIEGSQRIDPQTVRSYLRVDPGDPFDPLRLDESLKALFATGLFADVTLERQADTLIVRVVENPVINRIAFEGNNRIDDEELSAEVSLRPRVVFTRTKVQQDVQRILELYRRNGRFAATVEPKVIQLEQNRVDLVFEINEGEVTEIRSINFIGNRAFSDSTLRGEIATRESAWWRFLSVSDTYDPDRLAFDRELLRRFYLNEGYADFRVLSAVAELEPDRSGFIITFTLEEGPRYRFGPIEVSSTLRDLDADSLRAVVTASEGDWYDAGEIDETIQALTETVGNLGYAFVDVRPRTERDRENLTIAVRFDVQEGPKVFVERIDIQGNVRTLDRVVRREFRLVEGDAFNAARLRRSRQRIENLGFFRTVDVTTQPGSEPDRTIIQVDVEEQSTGDITFGAGVSTAVGPIGNIQLRERNLLGRGQDLRLSAQLSGVSSQVDLSFTEPYFLGRNLSAGIDLFRTTREQDESSFDQRRLGGGFRFGYGLTERTRQVLRYTLENREITNVDDDAALAVKEEEGTTLRSSVAQTLTWDRRDRRFDPTEGFVVSLDNQLTGLGGDVRFVRNRLDATYYQPIAEGVTLAIGGEVGFMVGLGEDTRVSDRFMIGGDSFRGFDFGGIGPRDRASGDSLGGERFYKGTLELSFPLGLPEEFDIRGRIFAEAGAVWEAQSAGAAVDDSTAPRLAVGPGISWNSPFGPVNLDLGFAIVKEDFDETRVLSFSFGTQF